MWLDNYRWHYDYARLAWDTGFCFDKYKYPNLDKNKIFHIFYGATIAHTANRNISTVVQYVLDNDQAEVLDVNFVKIFRLSQLSVEYLLFCKKYLDRTVVLLKKELSKLKEEIRDIKNYTEELETHISSSRNAQIDTFKCEICTKIFLSEDHLNSHLKSKHNGVENKFGRNVEAEKLHSEIKELKERLNNTEKFIQIPQFDRETETIKSFVKENGKDADDKTTKLVGEIQDSFEKFRKQVEDKMSSLQSEKNFFTEKYDKLFDIVLQYKRKEDDYSKKTVVKEDVPVQVPSIPKIETTTQTSSYDSKKDKLKKLQMCTVQHDNICDDNVQCVEGKDEDNIDKKIEKKLSNFEENIENKISSGLGNIETQINAFWEKLSEVELNYQKIGDHLDENTVENVPVVNKPKIKPRTKLTKQANNEIEEQKNIGIAVKTELDKMLVKEKFSTKTTIVKPVFKEMYESSSEVEYDKRPNIELKNKTPPVKKSSGTVAKNLDGKQIEYEKRKIRNAIHSKLSDLGIGPKSKGISQKLFDKAMKTLNRQSTLNKKSLPEYEAFKKYIENYLKYEKNYNTNQKSGRKIQRNVVCLQIKKRREFESSESKPDSAVTIKNRHLYDTESETDIESYLPKNFEMRQSAVIKELKSKFSASQKPENTDSDINSIVSDKAEMKSALKSSTDASSVKKKVLFDVEASDEVVNENENKNKKDADCSLTDFDYYD